jgi:hypothetical protein
VFRPPPTVLTAPMIATEIPAAISPYSMAVAPSSLRRNARTIDMASSFTGHPVRKNLTTKMLTWRLWDHSKNTYVERGQCAGVLLKGAGNSQMPHATRPYFKLIRAAILRCALYRNSDGRLGSCGKEGRNLLRIAMTKDEMTAVRTPIIVYLEMIPELVRHLLPRAEVQPCAEVKIHRVQHRCAHQG